MRKLSNSSFAMFLYILLQIIMIVLLLRLIAKMDPPQNGQSQIQNLKRERDSLNAELLAVEILLFRYENALEILEERNSQAALEFEEVFSSEIE